MSTREDKVSQRGSPTLPLFMLRSTRRISVFTRSLETKKEKIEDEDQEVEKKRRTKNRGGKGKRRKEGRWMKLRRKKGEGDVIIIPEEGREKVGWHKK